MGTKLWQKYVEDHLIYNEIRGTDEFNYDDEDQVNADREIYLSEQVTAFKVKVSRIYYSVDYRSRSKSRAVLVLFKSQASDSFITWKFKFIC